MLTKRLKSLIIVYLVLSLILDITSVGMAKDDGKKLKFAVVTQSTAVAFWRPVVQGMRDAAEHLGVEAIYTGPKDFDIPKQVSIMENLIESGIDGMAATLADYTAFDKVIKKCQDRNIPIICMSTGIPVAEKFGLAYIGQDTYKAGIEWGKKIVSMVEPGSKVCFLIEAPGQSSLELRLKGAKEILDKHGIKYDVVDTTTDRAKAYSVIENYYKANPDVAGFFSTDTTGGPMAAKFVEKNGLKGKVKVSGFDLVPGILQGIINGSADFTIDQYPYLHGYLAILNLYLKKKYDIQPFSLKMGAYFVETPEAAEKALKFAKEGYR